MESDDKTKQDNVSLSAENDNLKTKLSDEIKNEDQSLKNSSDDQLDSKVVEIKDKKEEHSSVHESMSNDVDESDDKYQVEIEETNNDQESDNTNLKAESDSSPATTMPLSEIPKDIKKYHNKILLILTSLIAAVFIVFSPNLVMRLFSLDKIMPKTTVSGVQVGGKNKQQFEEVLKQSYNSKKVDFKYRSQTKSATYTDIGLNYDHAATFNKARAAHRNNIADLIFFWRNVEIEPEYSIDSAKLGSFLNSQYGQSNPPKNSEIVFSEDQQKFIINPEQSGTGINSARAAKDISTISRLNDKPNIELLESEIKPDISTKDLEKLNSEANQYLENAITINWMGTSKTITNAQKKDWIKIKDEQDKYLASPEIKIDEPKNYITDLINSVKRDQAAKEVISAEGFQVVITEGADGREVANPERYINQFTDAFSNKQPLNLSIDIKTIPREVKDYSTGGGRWLYVDISDFKMVAYEGSNPVRTFAVSSGAPSFPTVTGNFKVWAKVRSQTMKGGSGTAQDPFYSVPNVEWISYFHQGYAVHGVYWHSDFGSRNRSHGCVGITNADAEWIYNWDSIGTPVIVRQ